MMTSISSGVFAVEGSQLREILAGLNIALSLFIGRRLTETTVKFDDVSLACHRKKK